MINNEFPPIGGGSATVNLRIFECLKDVRFDEIELLTCESDHWVGRTSFSQSIFINAIAGTRVKNIHHANIYELLRFLIKSFFRGYKYCKQKKPKVIFGWSTIPSGFVAVLLGKLFKIPTIVRVSGPDLPGFEERYSIIYPILLPFLKYIWRNTGKIIAKCTYERDQVLKHVPTAAVDIIPNGTLLREIPHRIERIPPHGPLRMVCTARIIQRKGIDILLNSIRRAVDRGLDVKLDILGTGDLYESLVAMSQNLNLDSIVTFHGYVEREAIFKIYQESHLFVLLSLHEGMSVAALEALGSGLPLILSDTGGSRDMVEDGKNGYIIPINDENSLIERIEYLIQNPQLISQFSDYSLAKAQGMTWEKIAEQYIRLLEYMMPRRE